MKAPSVFVGDRVRMADLEYRAKLLAAGIRAEVVAQYAAPGEVLLVVSHPVHGWECCAVLSERGEVSWWPSSLLTVEPEPAA